MSAKYTPDNKVEVKASGDANFYRLVSENDWIAVVQLNGKYTVAQQAEMMRAMAVAPELLEFAELVLRGIESGHVKAKPFLDFNATVGDSIPMQTIGGAARAVVAKARGEA